MAEEEEEVADYGKTVAFARDGVTALARTAGELYHGKVKRYKATQGLDAYHAHRKNCGRKSDFLRNAQLMRYVHKKY